MHAQWNGIKWIEALGGVRELMAKVPKASGGQPSQKKSTTDSDVQSRPQTKQEIIQQAGFTPKQVQRFKTHSVNHSTRRYGIVSRSYLPIAKEILSEKKDTIKDGNA